MISKSKHPVNHIHLKKFHMENVTPSVDIFNSNLITNTYASGQEDSLDKIFKILRALEIP